MGWCVLFAVAVALFGCFHGRRCALDAIKRASTIVDKPTVGIQSVRGAKRMVCGGGGRIGEEQKVMEAVVVGDGDGYGERIKIDWQ